MASSTRTRVALLQRVSESQNDWWSDTTSSAGGAAGATLVDTSLAQLSADDDFCAGWYARVTADASQPTNDGVVRKVSTYAKATGTITPVTAWPAQVSSGASYELHRISPTEKHNAINAALRELYPTLCLYYRDASLFVDNVLANADFSGFSGGAFTSWTSVNAPTLTQDTAVRFGNEGYGAKMVAGGSAGQMTQGTTTAILANIREIIGKQALLRVWVFATAASVGRIRLDWDGSSITSSDYHTGTDQWELLEIDTTVPSGATQVKVILEAAASGTAYFSRPRLFIGERVMRYALPSALLRVHGVFVALNYDEEGVYATWWPLSGYSTASWRQHHNLMVEGTGLLTQPSTDAGTTEIGQEQEALVVAYANMWLTRKLGFGPALAAQEVARYQQQAAYWQAEVERLKAQPGVRMAQPPVMMPKGWRVEDDANGRWLVRTA